MSAFDIVTASPLPVDPVGTARAGQPCAPRRGERVVTNHCGSIVGFFRCEPVHAESSRCSFGALRRCALRVRDIRTNHSRESLTGATRCYNSVAISCLITVKSAAAPAEVCREWNAQALISL